MRCLSSLPQRLLSAVLLAAALLAGCAVPVQPDAGAAGCALSIFSEAQDAYHPLAQEIAAAENAPLADTLAQALACRPRFLLWVAAPPTLTDAALAAFGQALQRQPAAPATGIITASSLEGARSLWQRRLDSPATSGLFAVNAANPAAHIPAGRILAVEGQYVQALPLSKASLADALARAAHLTFTGHGAGRYLRIDETTTFGAADVPTLQGTLVSTGSCQTLRPWMDGSIALGFVDRGAAGYSGFVFSPNEGYLPGEFDGLPLRHTWPGFSAGQVVQLQTGGTLQGFAAFPFHFLLGDPRNALQAAPPYSMVQDSMQNGVRSLLLQGAPAGVLPVRVPGGAAFPFVEAQGIGAASVLDPFYNSRMQMLDDGDDRLLLLVHPGGDLVLRLHPRIPWFWLALDILLDSLDHTLLYLPQSGGDLMALGFLLLPLAWAAWQGLHRRLRRSSLLPALAFGAASALLLGAWALLRLPHISITSKPVVFSPLSLAAAFACGSLGVLVFLDTRRRRGRQAGLLVMTCMSWMPLGFTLAVIVGINRLFAAPQLGAPLYNLNAAWMPLVAFLVCLALAALAMRFILKIKAWR